MAAARQWQIARSNIKALQSFQEGKETTESTPADQSDNMQKISKKRAWTFFPSASLEASLGRGGGGAGKSWSFVPGEGLDQTCNQDKGSERELDRMELSSVLRPEPGQFLGQVTFFKYAYFISTYQVREEATGRLYRVINAFEKEEEESWCSMIILGRLALILGIAASAVAGIVLLAAGKQE